jgi:hypothetical protein
VKEKLEVLSCAIYAVLVFVLRIHDGCFVNGVLKVIVIGNSCPEDARFITPTLERVSPV